MNKQNKINYDVNQTKEELEQKSKLPTNDIVFHELFGQRGNEEISYKMAYKRRRIHKHNIYRLF